jgi:hypothetical protein
MTTKEQEIMQFLLERVFDPVLNSPTASKSLKQGVRLTIVRMEQRDAIGMIQYFWSIDEFRTRFSDLWLA